VGFGVRLGRSFLKKAPPQTPPQKLAKTPSCLVYKNVLKLWFRDVFLCILAEPVGVLRTAANPHFTNARPLFASFRGAWGAFFKRHPGWGYGGETPAPPQNSLNFSTTHRAVRYSGPSKVSAASLRAARMGICWGQWASHLPQPIQFEAAVEVCRMAVQMA